jgi:hypothetical protein
MGELFNPTDEERAAIKSIGEDQDLSDGSVIRQALRHYQLTHERLKAGETVHWSGDADRAIEFAGPSVVGEGVYLAAVNGRQDFRNSYRASLARIAELEALLRECGEHIAGMPQDRLARDLAARIKASHRTSSTWAAPAIATSASRGAK